MVQAVKEWQDLPDLKATCPMHGKVAFIRVEALAGWVCSAGYFQTCYSLIPDETFTPDGGEVVNYYVYTRDKCGIRPALVGRAARTTERP